MNKIKILFVVFVLFGLSLFTGCITKPESISREEVLTETGDVAAIRIGNASIYDTTH